MKSHETVAFVGFKNEEDDPRDETEHVGQGSRNVGREPGRRGLGVHNRRLYSRGLSSRLRNRNRLSPSNWLAACSTERGSHDYCRTAICTECHVSISFGFLPSFIRAANLDVGLTLHNVFREDVLCRTVQVDAKNLGIDSDLPLRDHGELLARHDALHPGVRCCG